MKALHSRSWIWSRFVGFGLIQDISSDYFQIQILDTEEGSILDLWSFNLWHSFLLCTYHHSILGALHQSYNFHHNNKCKVHESKSDFSILIFQSGDIMAHGSPRIEELMRQKKVTMIGCSCNLWQYNCWQYDMIDDDIIVDNISQWQNSSNQCKRIHTALQSC